MVSLTEKYKGKPIHFIAAGGGQQSDKTDSFLKGAKGSGSNFTALGSVGNNGINVNYIPSFGIYDHNGNLRHFGSTSEMDQWIEKLLTDVPYCFVEVKEISELSDQAEAMLKEKTFFKALKKIEGYAAKDNTPAEKKAEAEKLVEIAHAFLKNKFNEFVAGIPSSPIQAVENAEAFIKPFSSSTLGKTFKVELKEITSDKDFKNKKKVAKEMISCQEKLEKKKHQRLKNSQYKSLFKKLVALCKKYPDFEVSKKALGLIDGRG